MNLNFSMREKCAFYIPNNMVCVKIQMQTITEVTNTSELYTVVVNN
jgi:hypothetical protein